MGGLQLAGSAVYLGQGTADLTASHYKVAILAPLVTNSAALQEDNDWVFLGTVLDGNPTQGGVAYASQYSELFSLFDQEHHTVDGTNDQTAGDHKAPIRIYGSNGIVGPKIELKASTAEGPGDSQIILNTQPGVKAHAVTLDGDEWWSGVNLQARYKGNGIDIGDLDYNVAFAGTADRELVVSNAGGMVDVEVIGSVKATLPATSADTDLGITLRDNAFVEKVGFSQTGVGFGENVAGDVWFNTVAPAILRFINYSGSLSLSAQGDLTAENITAITSYKLEPTTAGYYHDEGTVSVGEWNGNGTWDVNVATGFGGNIEADSTSRKRYAGLRLNHGDVIKFIWVDFIIAAGSLTLTLYDGSTLIHTATTTAAAGQLNLVANGNHVFQAGRNYYFELILNNGGTTKGVQINQLYVNANRFELR